MRHLKMMGVLTVGAGVLFAITSATKVTAEGGSEKIALVDNCDPRVGAGWNTETDKTQCIREEGSVTRAEFGAFLTSPLSLSVVGHPSWRIAPAFLTADLKERLRVRNAGGRGHTFTEVAEFGGGFIDALNMGLTEAEECKTAMSTVIAPGGRIDVTGLAPGNHKFQCCIHPWMRADVKVQSEDEEDKDR